MIIADTHVHFYPCYDPSDSLRLLVNNLNSHHKSAAKAIFLTERKECCFFSDLRDGRIHLPDNFTIEPTADEHSLKVIDTNNPPLYIFAGRQIATKERLEILSLTSDTLIDDGLSAKETIQKAEDLGAVPVLTWALGKWTGKRRSIVSDIIRSASPGKLLIGDSAMRPSFLPQPKPMNDAADQGLSIIAGSDPLPFHGDDQYMGTYATLIDGDIDDNAPTASIRTLLQSGPKKFTRTGTRCGPIALFTRQMKL